MISFPRPGFICVACIKEQPFLSLLCWQAPRISSLRTGESRLRCARNWLEFSSKSFNRSGHPEQMVLEAPPLLQCHDFKNKNDLLDLGRIPG